MFLFKFLGLSKGKPTLFLNPATITSVTVKGTHAVMAVHF